MSYIEKAISDRVCIVVYNGYDIKDWLKSHGFKFNKDS
jgi:hypothetical protein